MLDSDPIQLPFTGFHKLLMLAWAVSKLEGSQDEPFVFLYWDFRPPNIIVNKEMKIVG